MAWSSKSQTLWLQSTLKTFWQVKLTFHKYLEHSSRSYLFSALSIKVVRRLEKFWCTFFEKMQKTYTWRTNWILLLCMKFQQKTRNCDVFFLGPPPYFLTLFHKHINWHKIITRGRRNIPRPDFESSRRILSRYEFVDAKFYVFHAFL